MIIVNHLFISAQLSSESKSLSPLTIYSLDVEFFVERIKAQADLQFVKIFGD